MKAWKCPNCGEKAGVPVQYGLPTRFAVEAAERGVLVLGGCVLTDDDPPRCCTACRAALWPGGVFAVPGAGGDLRVVLSGTRTGRRLEASVSADWAVTIAWRGEDPREAAMEVDSADADNVHPLFENLALQLFSLYLHSHFLLNKSLKEALARKPFA